MNFSDLVAAVVLETSRPDMGLVSNGGDGRIPQKILASTLYLHSMEYFYKDIEEAQIVFDQLNYIQQIDTSAIPRYRSLTYLRKNDDSLSAYQQNPMLTPPILPPLTGGPWPYSFKESMRFLKIIPPDKILDDYGVERLDVAYQAGKTINIKSATQVKVALAGWYAYPRLGTLANNYTDYCSWIADERPYAIIFHASASVFATIGKQEMIATYTNPRTGLVPAEVISLIQSNIVVEGS